MQMPKRTYPELLIMEDIEEREMQWLWFPYIPMGSATMIFGPGGYGKSHITCELTACLTTGRPMPGQTGTYPPRKVLMLSAEDEYDVVLRPRLRQAGADLTKVAVPNGSFTLDKYGIKQMEDYMRQFEATVVFIDPMVHYIGPKVDMNRMNEVREVTGTLHRAAINSGSAVVIVHHSRKGTEGQDFEKASGSADFNNAVRSVLYTTKDKYGNRVLRHVKSNYAKLGPSISYDFGDKGIEWNEPYIEDEEDAPMKGKKAAMAVFLKDLLKDGPMRSIKVQQAAELEDYNLRTLSRAKVGLAESFARREEGVLVWYWRLLGDKRDPVPQGDFINGHAEISSMEERRDAGGLERRPAGTDSGPLDDTAPSGTSKSGAPVAGGRPVEGPANSADPLSRALTDDGNYSGAVAAILRARGKLK